MSNFSLDKFEPMQTAVAAQSLDNVLTSSIVRVPPGIDKILESIRAMESINYFVKIRSVSYRFRRSRDLCEARSLYEASRCEASM